MTCQHENTELREKVTERGQYIIQYRVCLDCGKDFGQYPPRISGVLYKGKGTNDRRFVRGEVDRHPTE